MNLKVFVAGLVLFTAATAAQTQTEVDPDPGLVKADSPIYNLDVAVDSWRAGVLPGYSGEVAYERASEVYVAEERGNEDAFTKAETALQQTAEQANKNDAEGLQKAEQVLLQVENRTPEQAQQGIQQALDSVRQAQTRQPETDRGHLGENDTEIGGLMTRLDNKSGRDDTRPSDRGR
jgi:hypothetical protein